MSTGTQRAFLFGPTSMLGWALLRLAGTERLRPYCNPFMRHPACAPWPRLRLEDEAALRDLLTGQPPDLLIHCGGVCDVERCEAHPEWARQLNVTSIKRLLRCLPASARLVYCSSDHVFGGHPDQAFHEASTPRPISTYGRTRVEAEELLLAREGPTLVLRTGLAVGPSLNGRTGHLDWLRYRTRRRLPTTVVHDEFRSAVWTDTLARRVWALACSSLTGVRHVAATECISRLTLARHLDRRYRLGARLRVVARSQQPYPHLGHVRLTTRHRDALAMPLPGIRTSEPAA